jgi:hypothetical protein
VLVELFADFAREGKHVVEAFAIRRTPGVGVEIPHHVADGAAK